MAGEKTRKAIEAQPEWLRQVPADRRFPGGRAVFTGCGTSFHAAQTGGEAVQALELGEIVEVGVRAARFGTKSFDLEYELRADGRRVAEARSVCVGYDYASGETVPIPEAWREQLAA